MSDLTRRDFLHVTAGGSAVLTIGFVLGGCAAKDPMRPDPSIDGEINAWLLIGSDDSVTVRIAKAEMGQGIATGLAMLVAEELGCAWEHVRVEPADLGRNIDSLNVYGGFLTDGSASLRGSRKRVLTAGANARLRLMRAAAERWGVRPSACEVREGVVHGPDGQSSTFGALAAEAAAIDIDPKSIRLKSPDNYELVGRAVPRPGGDDRLTGKLIYGIDVVVPGMRYAAVLHGPVLGARPLAIDDTAARRGAGVLAIVPLEFGVAVVANSFWQATQAVRSLDVEWDDGANIDLSTDALRERFADAVAAPAPVARDDGDVLARLGTGPRVSATYEVPYLAHACMEPLNCTAAVGTNRVDIWIGTQDPLAVVRVASAVTGVAIADIRIHRHELGGGFGRRLATDQVRESLLISAAVDYPVKTIWTREDDIGQGYYRPMAHVRCEAAVDRAGYPEALLVRTATDSIFLTHRPDDLVDGFDPTTVMGLTKPLYRFSHYRMESAAMSTGVPTWMWRSVGATQNAFALESFLDELAVAADRSPIDLRRPLLEHRPDALRLLDEFEQLFDVDAPEDAGVARGFAMYEYARTLVAMGIEIDAASPDMAPRVTCVVDCGHVVHPGLVEQQIQGGIVFALSAARFGAITFDDGQVQQRNFDRYRIATIADIGRIDVHLRPRGGEYWGGIGEVSVPPLAPALCNALYRATGRRIRKLPIEPGPIT